MSMLEPKTRSDCGAAIQEEIMGNDRINATPLDESWRDFVFAEVWSRPELDRRARYLISLSGAAICGGDPARLDGYVRGALNGGELTLSELREAALHLAVYAGWSRGDILNAAISRAVQALGLPEAAYPPIRAEAWDAAERGEKGQAEFAKAMIFSGGPSVTPFMTAINNFVFGEMWCRDGLDQRSRRFITLVGVAESSAEVPIKSHFHSAMASGNCSAEEMHEFVLQYGTHAGWPKASLVHGIVIEMAKKVAAGLPWNG